MNKIRFGVFAAGAALVLAAGGLHAQTSIQRLTFSLVGEYQTNIYYTNSDNALLTNDQKIRPILITTHNIIKALAVDLEGTNWDVDRTNSTNLNGAELVREVNFSNGPAYGTEGIFLLRSGTNAANVSRFFAGSYSNNFTAGLSNAFPALTNYNPIPPIQLDQGSRSMNSTNTTTHFTSTAGLYFISLNTTNIKFNLVGVGDAAVTNVGGRIDGTIYPPTNTVQSEYLGTAGSFYLNVATNIFGDGTNPPVYFTGPMHGTFNVSPPRFSTISWP
jgi:hypothetical protein